MRRKLLLTIATTIVLCCGFAAFIAFTYVYPPRDDPRSVDAIVVLGGLHGRDVVSEALSLKDDGYADLVFISEAFGKNTVAQHACERDQSAISCFHATPNSTRGEAEYVQQLAVARGWTRVLVVTSVYHVSRARLIFGQCYEGEALFIGVTPDMAASDWVDQFVYQSGATLKALADPDC